MCVLTLSTNFVRNISQDMIKIVQWFSCKVVVSLLRFKNTCSFLNRFSKYTQISDSTKIRPLAAELFHADRRRYMPKLTVAFRTFAKSDD